EELLGARRLAGDPLPAREHLAVPRLEREELIPHLPSQLVRFFALQDDGQVRVTRAFHDERVAPVADRAEALPPEDREGGAHEILDHVERCAEEVLIDDALPGADLRADEGAVLIREEDRLDRVAAGLENTGR